MNTQVRKTFRVVHNIVLALVVFVVVGTFGLYQFEKGSTADDYIAYFGNVATANDFTYPEPASFYAFGEFHNKDTGKVTFVNNMWCKPIGQDVNSTLIDSRIKTYEDYAFVNEPPDIHKIRTTRNLQSFFSFGATEQELIRSLADDHDYLKWNMGDIAPRVDSSCYVTADVITYTDIFDLPKTTTYTGSVFTYYTERK